MALLLSGFALPSVEMLGAGAVPPWQVLTTLFGTLLLPAPGGDEAISLGASVVLAVGLDTPWDSSS